MTTRTLSLPDFIARWQASTRTEHPTWLDLAQRKLDAAVFDAYGWSHDLTDEQILERLLALNLERAARQNPKAAPVSTHESEND
jgi:hypothetical protein